jgi:glycosyltransferase involved in cell wall biosynthesis
MKKILIVASVISMIEWFNKENIEFLKYDCGYAVHLAVNLDYMDDTNVQRTIKYIEKLENMGIVLHNIHFARNPLEWHNIKVFKQLKEIISEHNFDLIHCHTPVASMLTRLAAKNARKKGTHVMYTCHGFHFHRAASVKNWILYYPVEKILARYTDSIVTINKEDYGRIQNFSVKWKRYIPGVGVDINKFKNINIDKKEKKKSIGVPSDAILVLSIGELIERKNHEIILEAISKIDRDDIFYAICGRGPLENHLIDKANDLGLSDRFILLGFRQDIAELCHAADISAFPSKIEGLGLAGIEAMSAGVPLIASNVHGILDYVSDGETGFSYKPNDVEGFAEGIKKLASSEKLRDKMRDKCIKAVEPFEIENALNQMHKIYLEVLE